jgi:hypothetical protein
MPDDARIDGRPPCVPVDRRLLLLARRGLARVVSGLTGLKCDLLLGLGGTAAGELRG